MKRGKKCQVLYAVRQNQSVMKLYIIFNYIICTFEGSVWIGKSVAHLCWSSYRGQSLSER